MISRSQMNRQLYQMGGEGMQEGIGSMMGQAMMQPQAQEQVSQKDYAKIKQILKQLYASNPQKFQEFLMKIKDKIPPKILQELVMTIQEEDRNMAAMGGIMSVPRARYGFGSFVSSIAGGIGDFIGGAADVVGDVVGGIGDVVGDIASSVDLGDIATAAAFYFGGPQAAALVNNVTGGTGNKYLDMGLNLYAGGTGADGSFSLSNLGGSSFQAGPGSQPNIFGDFGKFGDIINTGMKLTDTGDYGTTTENEGVYGQGKPTSGGFGLEDILSGGSKILKGVLDNKDIIKDLAKTGASIYAAKVAKEDRERVNRIVEEENRRFREAQAAKRTQYGSPSALGVPEQATTEDVVRAPVAMGGIMEVDREKYGFGSMFANLINTIPELIKETSSQNNDSFVGMQFGDFIDRDKDGIDDRKQGRSFLTAADVVRRPAAMGGRMRYAMGNSVRDGIMAAPRIAMQMGMPVGNPRRNQQGIAELDYRDRGGFVPPIGIKERADDIPAMLSNNEFVFTADAVKNADPQREQNPERGAREMYALMKRLENGGIV
jgi:hypothetical protein